MSLLSVALTPRRRPSMRAADLADSGVRATMADMVTGQRARVVGVDAGGDDGAARRLFDLGFVPGADVEMVRRAPLADPVVFRVAGYDIALRRQQARWVSVSAISS